MLGDENSTMIFFLPELGSEGSRSPKLVLNPYEGPFLRIEGSTSCVRWAGLKKNFKYCLSVVGGSTRGESGNYTGQLSEVQGM